MIGLKSFVGDLVNSIVSLLKVFFLSKYFPQKPPKEKGACIILGNGPSAKLTLDQNLEQVKKMTCFCVNHFASNSEFELLKPNYYVLLDPAFHDPKSVLGKKLVLNLVSKTTWGLTLLVPYSFRKSKYFLNQIKANPNITLHYFNYTVIDGFKFSNYALYNLGLGMPLCQNVLIATIFQSIRMGFDNIYLTGADHSWNENLRVSNTDNTLYLNDSHFYGKRDRNLSDEFGGEKRHAESQIAKQFISFYKVFKGHEKIANYAQMHSVEIINVSSSSNIDVYERGKL